MSRLRRLWQIHSCLIKDLQYLFSTFNEFWTTLTQCKWLIMFFNELCQKTGHIKLKASKTFFVYFGLCFTNNFSLNLYCFFTEFFCLDTIISLRNHFFNQDGNNIF